MNSPSSLAQEFLSEFSRSIGIFLYMYISCRDVYAQSSISKQKTYSVISDSGSVNGIQVTERDVKDSVHTASKASHSAKKYRGFQ